MKFSTYLNRRVFVMYGFSLYMVFYVVSQAMVADLEFLFFAMLLMDLFHFGIGLKYALELKSAITGELPCLATGLIYITFQRNQT